MPIQTIIKEKRKEIGLTQEQVADYLGVSTPAVNKWENGATYPDISLLAPLARLLKIDLNTLLCFQEELTEQEIHLFSNKVMATINQDGFESGLILVQEKIEQYPNSAKLIHDLVLLLDGAMMISGMDPSEKEKYDEPIDALYERIIQCSDLEIRNEAIFMLASKYIKKGKFDKAQEMIHLLPKRSALDKRLLQANLLDEEGKTEQAEEIHERILLMSITEIWNNLLTLIEMEIKLGNLENASELAAICSQSAELFNLADYYKIVPLFQVAVAEKNEPDSIKLMESLMISTKEIWNFSHSILFKHIPIKDVPANSSIQILPAILTEISTNPNYDFLRKSERFQSLLKHYHAE